MSFQAENAVWHKSRSKGTARLVMLCLAYHMNDKRREAWPGMATLKRETGASIRSIERAIEQLVSDGEIEVLGGGLGRGNAYVYRFLIPVDWPESDDVPMRKGVKLTPFPVATKGDNLSEKGDILSTKGDNLSSLPYRTINNKEEQLDTPAPAVNSSHSQKSQNGSTPPADPDPDLEAVWDGILATMSHFEKLTGIKRPYGKSEKAETRMSEDWIAPIHDMRELANGRAEELMRLAVSEMTRANLTIGSPRSINTTFCRLHREAAEKVTENPFADMQSNGKGW